MNYQHVTSDICHLVDENNQWSSTILIPQGDGFLDISSALMGDLSATSVGATKQPTIFPTGKSASFYRFDPDLYQGEESWPTLKEMLINAAHVSGCRLSKKNRLFESVLIGKPPMNCDVVMGSQLEGWVILLLTVMMLGFLM
jgi:hypothetical protein